MSTWHIETHDPHTQGTNTRVDSNTPTLDQLTRIWTFKDQAGTVALIPNERVVYIKRID
jgi:hypothetical protein